MKIGIAVITLIGLALCGSVLAQTKDPIVVSPEHISHHVSEYGGVANFNMRISEVHHTAKIRVRLEVGEVCEVHPRTQHDLDLLKNNLLIANMDALSASFGAGRPAPQLNDIWFPLHYRIGHDKLYVLTSFKDHDGAAQYLEYVYPISDCH
jgi:hypothetical protein